VGDLHEDDGEEVDDWAHAVNAEARAGGWSDQVKFLHGESHAERSSDAMVAEWRR